MKNLLEKTKNILINTFVVMTGAWILFALCFQLYGVYLVASNQDDEMSRLANEITHRIDGRFSNSPENIWYEKK